MPSIFVPTKTRISSYQANPAQLIKDKESETFFVVTDESKFLLALSQAIQAGNLSLTYNTTTVHANLIKTYLTVSSYGYGFNDSDIVVTPNETRPSEAQITVTWAYA